MNSIKEKRKNIQFYTMKFKSLRLKEYGYNIKIDFQQARDNGEIIGLFDNQFLRSIRKIHNKNFTDEYLNNLKKEVVQLKKDLREAYITRDNEEDSDIAGDRENAKSIEKTIKELSENLIGKTEEIDNLLFIQEYVTIVMEHDAHYDYLYKNGLYINGKKYVRFSCSAGQARNSTVVFVEEETAKQLQVITDNGRNLEKKFSPSKLNAYIGLGSSATQIVSKPRFCIIPDYETKTKVKVNFITETSKNEDDIIDVREIELPFNRFDGMGLISVDKARQWADELGLDYIPAQWCIRQSYLKGMLCTFDIHKFCEEKNGGNYIAKTSYKDENGNIKTVNLKDIDVICTESQFKLWDSYNSQEEYEANCDENELEWGVSLYTPKEDKETLNMNYQFLQTLNLNKDDVKEVCKKSVDWINGVTDENIYYTLLFLLGENMNEESIKSYLKESNNYWVKSLILEHDLLNDKYIKGKIYDLIKKKIKDLCLGRIIVDGNYQVIVSDPYAFMEYACGFSEVKGLLGEKEYYSNYWNNKNIKLVDSMRAPLTFRSEHVKLPLKNNKELNEWYKYCYTGIIVNIHGSETLNWAGSDFDYDILATTCDNTILNGVYDKELPVVYEPPHPEKIIVTEDKMFESDKFSFGSIIGQITNKSTSGYALLPLLKEDSVEHEITLNRIKMCTKLQSAQIDKAKIGREVKGIPKAWTQYNKIKDNDSQDIIKQKQLNNKLLLNKHPYFFKFLYNDTRAKINRHKNGYDLTCKQQFGISLDELLSKKRKNNKQRAFLDQYYEYMPVIDSDSVMNNICKYIEGIEFNIKSKIKGSENKYELLMSGVAKKNEDTYKKVFNTYKGYIEELKYLTSVGMNGRSNKNTHNLDLENETACLTDALKKKLLEICPNVFELVDYSIEIFYVDNPSFNKNILWSNFGDTIYENIKDRNGNIVKFPLPNEDGDINYLNKIYKIEEVVI